MLGKILDGLTPYSLNRLARKAHEIAVDKGWWTPDRAKSPLECLMLVVTEVAEAAEEVRKGQMTPSYIYQTVTGRSYPETRPSELGHEHPFEVRLGYSPADRPEDGGSYDPLWRPLTHALAERLGYEVEPVGLPSELADIIIRTLDLAASLDIDIDAAVIEKMEYNATRPAAQGGKLA